MKRGMSSYRYDRPMRVAHVITRMIVGGAQENTLLTCEDLIHRHGDEVVLITGPTEGPEGSLLARAEANRVPVEFCPAMRRAIRPWHDAPAYWEVKRALRDFQPDVVHTHSAKAGILGRAAGWALRVPAVVHTIHGAPTHAGQNPAARAAIWSCERWAARRCHRLISVADAMTDQFLRARVATPEKFTTVYSGMEVEPFLEAENHRERVRRELGYGPDDVVVGKIARLFHHKGHADVIRAMRRVVTEQPRTRLLLVGGGILREELQRMVRDAGLAEHVQFTGLVPPGRIPDLLAAMDVVVHASYREGLARALPQALLCRRAVVAYDLDGSSEVVLPDETGWLVDPGDVEQLARRLSQLVADRSMRERFGTTGRNRFADVFRHQRATERIREIYQSLLEPSPARIAG